MFDFWNNPFLLMALGASMLASCTGGIIGSYVVTKRIAFITGSISHSVLGGMGLFLWLQRTWHLHVLSPIQGALLFAIGAAILLGWAHTKYKAREDSVIASLWAIGMSLGVIFIAFTPGYNVELMHFLFGNILWVTPLDLITLTILNAIVISCTLLLYRKFQAICFDEEQALLQGLPVRFLYIFLLCLVAISTVVLIQIVGAVLVISMLTLPAAIAGKWAYRLSSMMRLAIITGMLCSTLGLCVSYELNWPPGATITLISSLAYLCSLRKKSELIRPM